MKERLHFYTIDIKYVRNLAQKDDNVRSVSPQINKNNRPLVGVLVMVNGRKYCVPLSSPKPKHETMKNGLDFLKIKNSKNKTIGVINLNNMISVDEKVIHILDLKIKPSDNSENQFYKRLLNDQLDWCNDNRDLILNKAQRLYEIVNNPQKTTSTFLLKRCCNFKKLEIVLDNYIKNMNAKSQSQPTQQSPTKEKKIF